MTTFKVAIPEDKISSFKEFLETIGVNYTELNDEFELTDSYKAMMNELLDRHEQGKLSYLSEEEFRYRVARK